MRKFPFPLRYSIPIILIFCGGLLGFFSSFHEIKQIYQNTENEGRNYLKISAGQTAIILDYLYRREDMQNAVITIISQLGSDSHLKKIILFNENNIVQVSSRYDLINLGVESTTAKSYLPLFYQIRNNLQGQILLSKNNDSLMAFYPVLLDILPGEIQPSRIGILFFEYDLNFAREKALNNIVQRNVVSFTLLTIFCIVLWFFFELTLTRRVSKLVSASNSFSQGNLNIRTQLSGSDELAKISYAFDRMASRIEKNTLILEKQLRERKAITEKLKDTNIKLELATKAKSEFLANMSHEIRTPMNGVISITELLALTNLDDQQRELVDIIQDSGKSLLNIINDILDFSKIEANKIQLEEQCFNLFTLVKSVCILMSKQAEKKQIKLEYNIDSDIPLYFLGDSFRLRQILLNLISNALKFTPKGNVLITINIDKKWTIDEQKEELKYQLLVTVKDTGIGIDRDKINTLFDPFIQGDASINRQYGGTGLGLTISKNLVELMGGTIWVESNGKIGGNPPDNWYSKLNDRSDKPSMEGAIFYFTFQIKAVLYCNLTPNNLNQENLNNSSSQVESSPLKILLAEDNKVNQKVALLTLKKIGYTADIANNGLEVLEMLEKQFYDVILMDMQMPKMDGITATQKIRQSSTKQPIIIAVTANILEEDRQKCFDAGMDNYISKPIGIIQLKETLANLK
ncbi:response regulator [Geminocystis herdmanii]|uniref:response regulator n=1 Tax=Geminocystis herdmanii TaxID=669359 RepID=UPI00034CDB56|nr:response regulator [Geminocystis herdmanii]